ncbi:hypothetical protein [Chitinophaga alhagiae]|uniref:hypothetical protein n=1 Tax=Chitinophaga alhagiae TaxID=2203219 RepID=UPI000E5C1B1A|nr:hypothetical protein [Chitinophaga alhagiae]
MLYLLLPVWLLACPARLHAQDANYWSAGYGPAGFFMPGAVIAQNRDSGVLFYNPALLVNTQGTTSSLTGTIYQWHSIFMKDGLGTGLPLRSQGTSIVPMVASHAVPYIKRKLPFTLAYAIVHTPVIDYGVSQQKDVKQNVLGDAYSPGPETFIGQYKAANRIDQTSFQLAAGMRVSPKLSAGLTMEGVLHRQSFTVDFVSRAMMNPAGPDTVFAPITTVSEDYTATYRQIGFRARLGLAWEISASHHAGLLVTTPVWKILGKGTVLSNVEISNLMLGNSALNLLASSRQTRLPSRWKDPLSLAAGYTYLHKKGQLYACVEYFARVQPYLVLTPRSAAFIRPDTSNTSAYLELNDARKAVVNIGIGASYEVAPAFMLFASLRTDFSYAYDDTQAITEGYNANVTNWNMYHAQLGANLRRKRYYLRTGLLLSYGRNSAYLQKFNFDHPDERNLLIGNPGTVTASTVQAGLLVSYIHNF